MYKKISIISIVVLSSIVLSGCRIPYIDDVKEQKDAIEKLQIEVKDLQTKLGLVQEDVKTVAETKKVEAVKVIDGTAAESKKVEEPVSTSFIKITSPENDVTLTTQPVVFLGTISSDTTKVSVESEFIKNGKTVKDSYTLKNFKEGDPNFSYKASQTFGNLGIGKNTFRFTAVFKDGKTQTFEIVVNYSTK
ncbi:hypothetical protein M0P48_05290 [Candidatus Gracilibacteria bacterium]|jgi:outer membrane murein-binding lipoprotein Lpp|nr:hypothetical protein [Candidatus Gracilibacteria bacterium]